jgi:hypothetical protein
MIEPHLTPEFRQIESSSLFLYHWQEKIDAEILLPEFIELASQAGVEIHMTSFARESDKKLGRLSLKNLSKRIHSGQIRGL